MNTGRLVFDPSFRANIMFLGGGDPAFRGSGSMMKMEETSKKRPFFTSPDELFDEEYYDEQSLEKKRRLTPEQVYLLEKSFEEDNKLEPERKTVLAKDLGLQPRQVAVWFQNRRARWKTKQLERDYDQLKHSYESLRSEYDTMAKENDKLKSEVILLTEKLQAQEAAGEPEVQKTDALAVDETLSLSPHMSVKVEDHLSTGSGGSAVVDEDGLQLLDCGDSYFSDEDNYPACIVLADGVHLKDDDDVDVGHSYFTTVFEMAGQQNHVEAEPVGWWVWS